MARSPQPGADLVVPAGPGLPQGMTIPAGELLEHFSRAAGPGGQGVNTTDSRVQLTYRPASSIAVAELSEATRDRLLRQLEPRLTGGQLVVVAAEHRAQRQNRQAARERLIELLRKAAAPPPPPRRATRPTRGSQRRRLETKRQRSQIKAGRGRVTGEGH
ncbi:aminoacyl-tRNA hydrolase [Ornithinimicrobium sp. F0845]|uniref:alternative ribosome rescue aminoacyl-tRNA hydrolase ArfB n=1 Tax=Ornithinimicrobium sp. F0845 TaxID=2926412 RepID=UPI001FF2C7BB|nr:alternative ribosome rescue aminoacyl-tRNA hydrolase ArfB [Ornithinimicrobium sp. F0845]MCK0113844.1 aminoacyl-tRNA hydrolase [Ornithinimicrobium sp. F0845]